MSVAVMLPPAAEEILPSSDVEAGRRKAQEYMDKYYQNLGIRVYWGTVAEFTSDLRTRMNAAGLLT
jgi:hypothetical protein